jgi:UDP-N-acetylglucosamine 2-epimerase (non-hydrolysing)
MDAGRPHFSQPVPTVLHAVAGREDLMRMAPVLAALERRGAFRRLVVQAAGDGAPWGPGGAWAATLGVPPPARRLRPVDGLPGRHTAAVLEGFERVVLEQRPALVVVAGDHDAVPACALAAYAAP